MRINIDKLTGIIKAQSGVKLPNIITDTSIGKFPTFDSNGVIQKAKPINLIGQSINKQVNISPLEVDKLNKLLPTISKFNDNFIKEGYTPVQSAGIIGNLFVESGLKSTTNQNGGGPGFGIGQWEKGNPRYIKLAEAASKVGKPVTDEDVQLNYLNQELTSPDRFFKENA